MRKFLQIFVIITLFFVHASATENQIPLFKAYPSLPVLTDDKPRVHHAILGTFPTPVQKLETLGAALNHPNLWIKRDDKTGELFGGNKVRKLEFLLGDALANNAKGVLTVGYAGSNHTTATTVYAQKNNLECFCLHTTQVPTKYLHRNLCLSKLHGAQLNHFNHVGERDLAKLELNKEFKERTGSPLYFIPSGGSNEIGALGFVNAIFELKEQIEQKQLPEPDLIYVACGSVATTAGLMLGIKAAGLKTKVVPICIEPPSRSGVDEEKLQNLYRLSSLFLHKRDATFPLTELTPKECLIIRHDFAGKGYGVISQEAYNAIKALNETEQVKLDGTYTGKAFAAMIHDVATQRLHDKVILFWNTFYAGEHTDRVGHVDYKELPTEYHKYFKAQLQELDQGV